MLPLASSNFCVTLYTKLCNFTFLNFQKNPGSNLNPYTRYSAVLFVVLCSLCVLENGGVVTSRQLSSRCVFTTLLHKGKVRFILEENMKVQRRKKYSSTLSLISALDVGGWSTSCPNRFTHREENRYPFYKRPGVPQGRYGRTRKISPSHGLDPLTFQPLVSRLRYPAHIFLHFHAVYVCSPP